MSRALRAACNVYCVLCVTQGKEQPNGARKPPKMSRGMNVLMGVIGKEEKDLQVTEREIEHMRSCGGNKICQGNDYVMVMWEKREERERGG